MSASERRLSRDFAVYGLGEVIIKAFSLITIPIYTRVFSPAEFGIFSYVTTLAGLLSAVLVLGGDSAYARFFFEARSLERRQLVTSTWISFLAAWSVVVALLLLPFMALVAQLSFGDAANAPLLVVALVAAPVSLINVMCAQVLRNEFRAVAYTVLNVVSTVLLVLLVVVAVVGLKLGLLGVLGGTLVAQLLMLPVRLWTARSMLRRRFSLSVLRELLAFGVPIVPTSLAYWVFLTSDRVLLGKLSTLDQLGLYSVANSLVNLASIAIVAFGQAWSPHAIRLYEEHRDGARRVFGRIMTYLLVGFGTLAVGFTVFAPELLAILTGPQYRGAAAAIAPLAIAMVAMASTQVTAGGITMAKRTHYLAVFAWLAALANVGLNLALDGPYGMLGAAWATAVAYVVLTLLYLAMSQRLWAVAYEARRSLTAVALVTVFTLFAGVVPGALTPTGVGLKILYCLAFAAACVLLRVLDRRELEEIRALVGGLRA